MAEADIWKLKGIKEGFEGKLCTPPTPLCLGWRVLNVNIFSEMIKWTDELVYIKCLSMNETVACSNVLISTDLIQINSMVKYIFQVLCKWENKLNRTHI